MGLKVQMRYSLPLFVYGQGIQTWLQGAHHARVDTAKLHWRVVRADGLPQLVVRNDNNVHVRLSKVMLRQGGAQHTMAQGLLGYVLPGSTRRWPLPAARAINQQAVFHLALIVNHYDTQRVVPVMQRAGGVLC
jgi:fimbrial chaperone protein